VFGGDEGGGVHDGAGADDGEGGEGGLAKEGAWDCWVGGRGGVVFGLGAGLEDGRLGAEVQVVEAVAVRVVAGGADFARVAEGEGEQDWVAGFGDGYAGADFAHVAGAFVA
jgi:hypothetical protein